MSRVTDLCRFPCSRSSRTLAELNTDTDAALISRVRSLPRWLSGARSCSHIALLVFRVRVSITRTILSRSRELRPTGKKSGCGCFGHGRGFYVIPSALAANIVFAI